MKNKKILNFMNKKNFENMFYITLLIFSFFIFVKSLNISFLTNKSMINVTKFNHDSIVRLLSSSLVMCELGEEKIKLRTTNNKLNDFDCAYFKKDTLKVLNILILFLNEANFKNSNDKFNKAYILSKKKILGGTNLFFEDNIIFIQSKYKNNIGENSIFESKISMNNLKKNN